MTLSLIVGCIWVLCATLVAFLPYRAQFPPGIVLLLAAPILLGWIALDHGVLIAAIGMIAFISMFRKPLGHLWRETATHRGKASP